ncbi:MAG: oligopeptide/dipeptide ABC transporter ATP-binding protein [Thermodesulfobacteriota bacterium]
MTIEHLVEMRHLRTWFAAKTGLLGASSKQTVKALDDVTLTIRRGEVLGLVGESGSGKTTLGRSILRLVEPTAGDVDFNGRAVLKMTKSQIRSLRREMQIIFQDPGGSLDPRMSVGEIIAEGLQIHRIGTRKEQRDRVAELLRLVDLEPEYAVRYPHEFSGGQRQRIGVARALAPGPSFVVADEPVSALDVSVKAQVINLLSELKGRLGLTILFISHDLAVVQHISDRVAVMYLGHIMETAGTREFFNSPRHPYTLALMEAIPMPDPRIRRPFKLLEGDIPSPINPPSGCVFRTRCEEAMPECASVVPELKPIGPDHAVACIRR